MLTMQDLQNIRMICREETVSKGDLQGIRDELQNLKTDVQNLRTEMQNLKIDMQEVKADVQNLKAELQEVKTDVQNLKADMQEVKADVQNLKAELQEVKTDVQQQIDDIRNYMHRKFIWIENDLMTKVNILYETRDMYVQYTQYQKRNEEVDNQFAYIASLFKVVKSHGERLDCHEKMLDKLMTGS